VLLVEQLVLLVEQLVLLVEVVAFQKTLVLVAVLVLLSERFQLVHCIQIVEAEPLPLYHHDVCLQLDQISH
jgi:hypothetical protein